MSLTLPTKTFPAVLVLALAASLAAQTRSVQASNPPAPQSASPDGGEKKLPRSADRRRAAKLYLRAGKLFLATRYEQAMALYTEAAQLDTTNKDYALAIGVARAHAVTALVQQAARLRVQGDAAGARRSLERALVIDRTNPIVAQHLNELGDDVLASQPAPPLAPIAPGALDRPMTNGQKRSFHLNSDARQVILQVLHSYGLEATLDDSVRAERVRLDLDDATFEQATTTLALLTRTFFVPLDPRRVLVAHDSREMRQQYTRMELETVSLTGLNTSELNELVNIAKNVFGIQTATPDAGAGTLTVRATPSQMDALNRTLGELAAGRSQVLLDVRLIQLAHSNERTTGAQLPQSFTAFNVYAEEQSILNTNSALVQQIISSGLASANDPLAILGILIASGQVSNSLFANGLATFGGGTTLSAISPGATSINLNVNSSQSRQLDRIQLRVADGDDQAASLKLGTRYPIQTSSYLNLGSSSSIAGLTGAGTSSALSSLLGSLTSSTTAVTPQVEYQDLGFTLKAKAAVMRNGRVALNLTLQIDALSGQSVNGNPILDHRSYEGDVQVQEGAAVVVASELDRTQSRAVSGTPGLDEIPGLSQTDSRDQQTSDSTLVVVVTPHVVRSPLLHGHSPALRIDRNTAQTMN